MFLSLSWYLAHVEHGVFTATYTFESFERPSNATDIVVCTPAPLLFVDRHGSFSLCDFTTTTAPVALAESTPIASSLRPTY
jgi:hypothetical protein